ncbi:MAG: NUDIX hydrolase [Candidatus Moraniibacteriota bacterium]|nr:MAG: NUDIX hydrolase [Candidatus Moranbacteria bacterium]
MPHIHTKPGQIDFIAEVFCVYQDRVLFRFHEKARLWIAPGGHIELHETPEEAAIREVKEETGLDVTLFSGKKETSEHEPVGTNLLGDCRELLVPAFLNVHAINAEHRHISLVYFGTVITDHIIQPENHEKAECRWLTREQVQSDTAITPLMKKYALVALETLSH